MVYTASLYYKGFKRVVFCEFHWFLPNPPLISNLAIKYPAAVDTNKKIKYGTIPEINKQVSIAPPVPGVALQLSSVLVLSITGVIKLITKVPDINRNRDMIIARGIVLAAVCPLLIKGYSP